MKNERKGNYYRLFTMNINGVNYYFIARLDVKGICLMFNKSGEAVDHFEILERQMEKALQKENELLEMLDR